MQVYMFKLKKFPKQNFSAISI